MLAVTMPHRDAAILSLLLIRFSFFGFFSRLQNASPAELAPSSPGVAHGAPPCLSTLLAAFSSFLLYFHHPRSRAIRVSSVSGFPVAMALQSARIASIGRGYVLTYSTETREEAANLT
jgi:hypothetical protein